MVQARFSLASQLAACLACAALAFGAASCNTRSRFDTDQKAEFGPVAMQGEAPFFNGQLTTSITISRGFTRDKMRSQYTGFKQDDTEQLIEQIQELDPESKTFGEDVSRIFALEYRGSRLPPIAMVMKVTNRSASPVEVEFTNFSSDLGNFAIQPVRLTIAPGETAQPEAVSSQLGLATDNLPVKVGLKLGGTAEIQTVQVRSLLPPASTKRGSAR